MSIESPFRLHQRERIAKNAMPALLFDAENRPVDNETNTCMPNSLNKDAENASLAVMRLFVRDLAFPATTPNEHVNRVEVMQAASIVPSPHKNRLDVPDRQDQTPAWCILENTRAGAQSCPPPAESFVTSKTEEAALPTTVLSPLMPTLSAAACATQSDSDEDSWDGASSGVAALFLTDAEPDTTDSASSTNDSFQGGALLSVCEEATNARAELVKRLRAERIKRFPNAMHTTMADIRVALDELPRCEEVGTHLKTGGTPGPLPHPFLDLHEQKVRVSMERWQRQAQQQQQQQRAQSLSRFDAYISCKMLVGAAHAHHVGWLRHQHTHAAGLSEEELRLLEDNMYFEWARLGQQVDEDLMFNDCALVLRRISCSCVFDPDSDMRQYGDAEEHRARRVARQRQILAKLEAQAQNGEDPFFLQS